MKRAFRSVSSLVLVVMLLLSVAAPAYAADSAVIFKGMEEGFEAQPGSEYTPTDLFDNFKNVMPGDKLTETITFKNEAKDCDYIKLYLRAETVDELTYSESFENTDGKDQADVAGQRDETVASMADFLAQLTMRIYNGETLIYESTPDKTGALANNVHLGDLLSGEKLELKVELDVPADLGNEYANRVGEVKWVFLVEAIEFNKLTVHKVWEDNGYPERPESVTVHLMKDGVSAETVVLNGENQWTHTWEELDDRYTWTVEEEKVEGYETSYKTEDNKVFITNSNDYVPIPEPDPVNITVKKVWSDDNDKNDIRPSSVTVTLYNGDEAVEKVTLSAKNGWTYSWEGLDGHGDWSVLETGIPKGYTPSYRTKDGVVTITNTATLIQTGQLDWPIPVLGGLGILMMLFGILMMKKRKPADA